MATSIQTAIRNSALLPAHDTRPPWRKTGTAIGVLLRHALSKPGILSTWSTSSPQVFSFEDVKCRPANKEFEMSHKGCGTKDVTGEGPLDAGHMSGAVTSVEMAALADPMLSTSAFAVSALIHSL